MNPQAPGSHLSDDTLIDHLYGLDTAETAHLEACEECSGRWEAVKDRRAHAIAMPAAPSAMLAQQRGAVLERLGGGAWGWRQVWIPALAAALLILAGAALYFPDSPAAPAPAPVAVETPDEDWYEVEYTIEPVEPRAASPLRELFEEEVATE